MDLDLNAIERAARNLIDVAKIPDGQKLAAKEHALETNLAVMNAQTVLALVARAREAGRLEEERDARPTMDVVRAWQANDHAAQAEFEKRWRDAEKRELAAEIEADRLRTVVEKLRADAERWQVLMGSQRLHYMGSAGFDFIRDDPESRKISDVKEVVARAGSHLHFGMEFWDVHAAYKDPKYPDDFDRKVMIAYVDTLRARLLAETAPDVPADRDGRAE